jgi:hypothetical protein
MFENSSKREHIKTKYNRLSAITPSQIHAIQFDDDGILRVVVHDGIPYLPGREAAAILNGLSNDDCEIEFVGAGRLVKVDDILRALLDCEHAPWLRFGAWLCRAVSDVSPIRQWLSEDVAEAIKKADPKPKRARRRLR